MSTDRDICNESHDENIKDDEIIVKDTCNEIHDEYIKDEEIVVKDICDEIINEYIEENKTFDKDTCDGYIEENKTFDKDICDEYIEKDKTFDKDICEEHMEEDRISNGFFKDNNKNMNEYSHKEESKMYINCNLKVDFDTKNKMLYLYPGKSQYFTVNVSRSCGDVTIKYKGCYTNEGICGNLGIYTIVQSGIVVDTYCKLNPKKKDFLEFTAIDKYTRECYDFVVVFSCDPCGCCCK